MKYLLLNELNYITYNKKKSILLMILFSLICIFLLSYSHYSYEEIFTISVGGSINEENKYILEYLMFYLNLLIPIYLIISSYSNDVDYQLNTYFLRTNATKWIINKNIVYICSFLIIKTLQFGIVLITISLFKKISIRPLILFEFILYPLIIQLICINVYFIDILKKYKRFLLYTVIIGLLLFLPKRVLNFNISFIFFGIIILILLCFINILIIRKYCKYIMEEL